MTTTGHVHFYIGTYTNLPSTSTGIARVSLNTETGELTRLDDVAVQRNPSLCRLMAIIRVIWISKNRCWRLLIMALEMLAYFNWIAMVNRLVC